MGTIIFPLFFFLSAAIGFAASFLFLFSKKKYTQGFYLGLFLFSMSFVGLYGFGITSVSLINFSGLFMIAKSFVFLVLPSFFLHIRNVSQCDFKRDISDCLYFLPFIGCFIFMALQYGFGLEGFNSADHDKAFGNDRLWPLILLILVSCAFFQIIRLLVGTRQENRNPFGGIAAKWNSIYSIVLIFLLPALFIVFFLCPRYGDIDKMACFLAVCVLLACAGRIYFSPHIFENKQEASSLPADAEKTFTILASEIKKDRKSSFGSLSAETKEMYLLQLENEVNIKKLFLDKDLNIKELSKEIGISPNILSYLINSEFGSHFNDYINSKRIAYFIDNIHNPEWKGLSLEGMSTVCGFGSRTSCFRAFLRHKGKSPSQYLETVSKNMQYLEKTSKAMF